MAFLCSVDVVVVFGEDVVLALTGVFVETYRNIVSKCSGGAARKQ